MSMMVSFVLSFFPRDVLDEILNLIESVSEDFPSYFCHFFLNALFLLLASYMTQKCSSTSVLSLFLKIDIINFIKI